LLLPVLAWADFGTSIDGKEASVTCTHTLAADSGWVVFCYDGDAGAADTLNCYDSVRVMPFPAWGSKTFWGDGLDLDSIGTHVVRIHYFSGDAVISTGVGIWEHKAGTPDVNMAQISRDATAANNAELFFDGTGYAGTNNVIPSVTTVTGNVDGSVASVTAGVSLNAAEAGSLGIMHGKVDDIKTATDAALDDSLGNAKNKIILV